MPADHFAQVPFLELIELRVKGAHVDRCLYGYEFLKEHIPRVEPRVQHVNGDCGCQFAIDDRPVDGRPSAVTWETGVVDVDEPAQTDQTRREHPVVRRHDHAVWFQLAYELFDRSQ